MTLVRRLADHALENHPGRAVLALERRGEAETVQLLRHGSTESAAEIVRRLSPRYATAVLEGLDPKRVARMLDALSTDAAARLIRRTDGPRQAAILDHLNPKAARSVRAVLRFPEGSAGAIMDPDVLALPQELSAREAVQRVRKAPEFARYNVYVLTQEQRLVGVLNLRELLIARGRLPLSDLMIRNPHRVPATADRATVLTHPGWKEVHSLPVVDGGDVYLGAIRYRTLRELEEELLAPRGHDVDTGAAFAQLISAGARGVLDALAGTGAEGGKGNG